MDDTILGLMKEMMESTYGALVQTRDLVVDYVHIHDEGHDTENFRGCTHPNCKELREYLRRFSL